jgi:predicted dehydrogenase
VPVTRLGVAGLGWLGESLIKDAVRLPEFEVVAVQDVVADRARDIAQRYGTKWCGEQYSALVARPDVDAVLICTPNHLHAQQAQQALGAGKDVLVQKPLALSASDARQTLHAAQAAGRLLFVDYTYRFLDTMARLRAAIRSAGAVHSVRAAFHNIYGPGAEKAWFFNPSTSGGGALMDLGVHLLDLGIWLVQPHSVVLEHVDVSQEQPVEHAAQLGLRLDSVPFGVAVSWNAPLSNTQIFLELDTDAGRLRWENVDGSFFHFRSLHDGEVLVDRETTLREDTLGAFAAALEGPPTTDVDTRVYEVLDQAYGRLPG